MGFFLKLRHLYRDPECEHSGLKCTPRRAPASRYIVAFLLKSSFAASTLQAMNAWIRMTGVRV